jgi:hypothetical protein
MLITKGVGLLRSGTSAVVIAATLPLFSAVAQTHSPPADTVPIVTKSAAATRAKVVDACPLGSNRRAAQGAVAGVFIGSNLALYSYFKKSSSSALTGTRISGIRISGAISSVVTT